MVVWALVEVVFAIVCHSRAFLCHYWTGLSVVNV